MDQKKLGQKVETAIFKRHFSSTCDVYKNGKLKGMVWKANQ